MLERIRHKYVLMELITYRLVSRRLDRGRAPRALPPRFPNWAASDCGKNGIWEHSWAVRAEYLVRGIGVETKLTLKQSHAPKMGLGGDTCDRMRGWTLGWTRCLVHPSVQPRPERLFPRCDGVTCSERPSLPRARRPAGLHVLRQPEVGFAPLRGRLANGCRSYWASLYVAA